MRRIGVLLSGDENDPRPKSYVSAFPQALVGLGWVEGSNVRMDLRWSPNGPKLINACLHARAVFARSSSVNARSRPAFRLFSL
jgi:hypothetical protein